MTMCSPSSVDLEWTELVNKEENIRSKAIVRVKAQPTTVNYDIASKTSNWSNSAPSSGEVRIRSSTTDMLSLRFKLEYCENNN